MPTLAPIDSGLGTKNTLDGISGRSTSHCLKALCLVAKFRFQLDIEPLAIVPTTSEQKDTGTEATETHQGVLIVLCFTAPEFQPHLFRHRFHLVKSTFNYPDQEAPKSLKGTQ
jgi:hypothetical protein